MDTNDTSRAALATLNTLIETCKDGEIGFRTAADGLTAPDVKEAFGKFARERGQMARELQDEVQGLGGTPETSGSTAGAVHRGWINIKSVVTGKDDRKIIAEAERGEDVAKAAFEAALKEALPPQVRTLVEKLAARVRAVHDQVRAMEKAPVR